MTEKFKSKGYLVTIDIEEAFHSLDHSLLLTKLEKFSSETNSVDRIKIFLNDQESCVINKGVTKQYFQLEKGTRQDDPISAYFFISCLEILFTNFKNNEDIKSLNILRNIQLIQATRLFLKKNWVQ